MHSEEYAGTNTGACTKHYMLPAVGHCHDCGQAWCEDCLVPPARKRQPVRCIACALVAAGVRAPGPRSGLIDNMSRNRKRPTNFI